MITIDAHFIPAAMFGVAYAPKGTYEYDKRSIVFSVACLAVIVSW